MEVRVSSSTAPGTTAAEAAAGGAMIHDGLALRVNGQPELIGWQFARRRIEKKLCSAFRSGQPVDLSPNGKPSRSGRAAASRAMVRAEAIIAMLRAAPSSGHGARLMLRGAYITGLLDLSYSRIDQPISLCDCVFDEPVVVTEARLSALTLDGSTFPGIKAQNLEVDGDL